MWNAMCQPQPMPPPDNACAPRVSHKNAPLAEEIQGESYVLLPILLRAFLVMTGAFVCSEKGHHRVSPFALWPGSVLGEKFCLTIQTMAGRTRGGGVISWLCACVNFAVRLICSHLSLEIDTREYNRGAEVSLFDCGFCSARAAAAIWNCLIIGFYSEHLIGDRAHMRCIKSLKMQLRVRQKCEARTWWEFAGCFRQLLPIWTMLDRFLTLATKMGKSPLAQVWSCRIDHKRDGDRGQNITKIDKLLIWWC